MESPKIISVKGMLSFHIMHELKKKGLCGDELAVKIGKKKTGKLTPGTIYPALKKLRDKGLIKLKQIGRKKIYSLTKKGDKEYRLARRILKKLMKGV